MERKLGGTSVKGVFGDSRSGSAGGGDDPGAVFISSAGYKAVKSFRLEGTELD
jgi:hypothetical protein